MGLAKRRRARGCSGSNRDPKSAYNEIPMQSPNPFPLCSIPTSIPLRYSNVAENLTSHVTLHRAISCTALSNIVCNDGRSALELIRCGLVPVVLPLLVDSDSDVATHAAGLLRNLALMDGGAFTDAIRNVFDDIVMLLLSRSDSLLTSWHRHILALVGCVTEHGIESPLFSQDAICKWSRFLSGPSDIIVAVLEIFRNVVDDRSDLAHAVYNHMAELRSLLGHDSILVRAHTTALFATIARLLAETSILSEIAPHFAQFASIDLSVAALSLFEQTQRAHAEINAEIERQRAAHTGDTIFQESICGRLAPEAIDNSWQSLLQLFREQTVSVQIAAESVANMIFIDEDEQKWSPKHVANLAGVYQLVPLLIDRIRTVIDADRWTVGDSTCVCDLIYGAIQRCVEAMINLVVNEIIISDGLFDLMMDVLERECFRTEPRLSLLEVVGRLTSLLLSRTPRDFHPDQLQMITSLASESTSESVRQEFVAVLVKFGTGDALKADLVAGIVCSRLEDQSFRVFLEATNGLLDMFANDVVHQQTMARLNLLPILSIIMSDERYWERCDKEMSEEAFELRANLEAFIKYRLICP